MMMQKQHPSNDHHQIGGLQHNAGGSGAGGGVGRSIPKNPQSIHKKLAIIKRNMNSGYKYKSGDEGNGGNGGTGGAVYQSSRNLNPNGQNSGSQQRIGA